MSGKSSHKYFFIVAACCLFMGVSVGIGANCDGVFIPFISDALGISRGAVTLFTTVNALAGSFLFPLCFRLTQKIGIKRTIIIGVILSVVATAGMGLAKTIYGIYIWAVPRAVGFGCFGSVVVSMLLARWFIDRLSFFTGIAVAFSGLCGAVFSPLFTSLIERAGYGTAFIVRAAIMLVMALPICIFCVENSPSDVGLEPYRSESYETKNPEKESHLNASLELKSLLFWLVALFYIVVAACSRLCDQLPSYAISIGQSAATGALLTSALMVGNVLSKVIMGRLLDRYGAVKVNLIATLACIAGLAMIAFFPGSKVVMMVGSFIYGTMCAIATIGVIALVRTIYGIKGYGRAMSMLSPIIAIYSVFTSAFAYLYDLTGTYIWTFLLVGVLCIVSIVLMFAAVKRAARTAGKEKA